MTLLGKVDNALVQSVSQWAAHYEHRIRLGQKPIFRASSSPLPLPPIQYGLLHVAVHLGFGFIHEEEAATLTTVAALVGGCFMDGAAMSPTDAGR